MAATTEGYNVSKAVGLELKDCEDKVINFELKKEFCEKSGVIYGDAIDKLARCPIEGALIYLLDKEESGIFR